MCHSCQRPQIKSTQAVLEEREELRLKCCNLNFQLPISDQ